MKAAPRLLLAMMLIVIVRMRVDAQMFSNNSMNLVRWNVSLDWAISPRGMALGEATVGVPGYDDPFASNPAGLAGMRGFWADYSRQPFFTNFTDDMQYRSWSLGAQTPIGVFMGTYRRLDYGEFGFTNASSPEPVAEARPFDYTVGLAWGYQIDSRFQVGIGVKMFDQKSALEWGTLEPSYGPILPESDPAYVIDVGLLSNVGSLFGNANVVDNLSFGVALQGFGTPFRLHYTGESTVFDPASGTLKTSTGTVNYTIPLARNLRIGFSYRLILHSQLPEGLNPMSIAVMGEYRDLLNASLAQGGAFWGVGLEVSIFELIQLRGGGLAEPNDLVYGNQNTLHGRYGVGVHLPLQRLVSGFPKVILEGSYSMMQLVNWDPSMLRAYSLGVRYEP